MLAGCRNTAGFFWGGKNPAYCSKPEQRREIQNAKIYSAGRFCQI